MVNDLPMYKLGIVNVGLGFSVHNCQFGHILVGAKLQ